MRQILIMTALSVFALSAVAQDKNPFIPEIHGTVRAKYEYEPQIDKGRFEIRNARLSVEGKVIPIVRYKAEIDLSDEGSIKMLDAYIRLQPKDALKFTFGQMRVPFTFDAHRSPHLQYFANRSFIAKQVGNVRDVGASVSWKFNDRMPVTLEGGIFNGSGLTNQKNFWTDNYNFSFKAETHRRFFEMMRSFGIHVRSFRADCGSYSEDIVKVVMEHTEKFYIRAERYAGLYEKVKRQTGWTTVEIGFQRYDVQSFPFESFEDVKHCRLVVQRQRRQKGEQLDLFDGEYTYRCILTNDWDMTDEEIILHYNKRGAAEQVFDRQNNDFGWAHLPKSFMNQNTVFLLITAMAANFYRYIVALPLMAVLFGIKATDRVKSFLFRFIAVPAKWIKTARQYKLNIYSPKPYNQIWEHG